MTGCKDDNPENDPLIDDHDSDFAPLPVMLGVLSEVMPSVWLGPVSLAVATRALRTTRSKSGELIRKRFR